MAGRESFHPEEFKNVKTDGNTIGYQFALKAQYYRGFTLSIVRDIQVMVDGENVSREDIRFTVSGVAFTLDEMRTVIDPEYRWEFGDYAIIAVSKAGGLAKGAHHIWVKQIIAPSYMPFQVEAICEADFEIK